MFRTASNVCTGKERKVESLILARKIAISNGYDTVEASQKQLSARFAAKEMCDADGEGAVSHVTMPNSTANS
ncbi:hypothetical protein KIN20_000690 [Parelaphostrongylus tenuis]|uniref:Uncharacterized protein n=1 Tax=Parelaphostrongylus tenuis TaxID=148309 RepID=A0AAD5MDN6_PARTN|nr:hypothetical protein KIN20_000690 [Parelaphostrongylus tenuis]